MADVILMVVDEAGGGADTKKSPRTKRGCDGVGKKKMVWQILL
jgi:hypothetical protein